jgi:hypothetical protein
MYGKVPGPNVPAGDKSQEAAVKGNGEIGFSYQIADRFVVGNVCFVYILNVEIMACGACYAFTRLYTQIVIVSL